MHAGGARRTLLSRRRHDRYMTACALRCSAQATAFFAVEFRTHSCIQALNVMYDYVGPSGARRSTDGHAKKRRYSGTFYLFSTTADMRLCTLVRR
jgi:hypothetical protein